MARKRFKPEEIVAILRESERGISCQELLKKHNISGSRIRVSIRSARDFPARW